jgi:hypothetical protein
MIRWTDGDGPSNFDDLVHLMHRQTDQAPCTKSSRNQTWPSGFRCCFFQCPIILATPNQRASKVIILAHRRSPIANAQSNP